MSPSVDLSSVFSEAEDIETFLSRYVVGKRVSFASNKSVGFLEDLNLYLSQGNFLSVFMGLSRVALDPVLTVRKVSVKEYEGFGGGWEISLYSDAASVIFVAPDEEDLTLCVGTTVQYLHDRFS